MLLTMKRLEGHRLASLALILGVSLSFSGCTTLLRDRTEPVRFRSGCIETGRTYAPVEVSFRVPDFSGHPFRTEFWGRIERPAGPPVRVPAFFDDDLTWRVRYTPDRHGRHSVTILQGPAHDLSPVNVTDLKPAEFVVAGAPAAGFVRTSSQRVQQFVLDDGSGFYPIGYNVGWGKPEEFVAHHRRMQRDGLNWSRHWMACFSGLQLDWSPSVDSARGYLDLNVARKWDEIVRSAEQHGIRFQLVLQHHGQYSSSVNPNWPACPWRTANGGFLNSATAFFTDDRAQELTRWKYRYIVARWGYSTAVMAWELWNEVQFTDAWKEGMTKPVARWHREMAAWIRSLDPYRHLLTTSSLMLYSDVNTSMDYLQVHHYGENMIDGVRSFGVPLETLRKPVFFGEVGDNSIRDAAKSDGRYKRSMIWAGLMTDAAGAAQYWTWDDGLEIAQDYRLATDILTRLRVAERAFVTVPVSVDTRAADEALPIVPEGDFGAPAQPLVLRRGTGNPFDPRLLPRYVHGGSDKVAEGMAARQFFTLESDRPERFEVSVGTIARAGSGIHIVVDGEEMCRQEWPRADADREGDWRFSVDLTPGRHRLAVNASGPDWFRVRSYTWSGHARPGLRVLARSSGESAFAWVYSAGGIHTTGAPPVNGVVTVPGLRPGAYRVEWWRTDSGSLITAEDAVVDWDGQLSVSTPPVARDVVFTVRVQ